MTSDRNARTHPGMNGDFNRLMWALALGLSLLAAPFAARGAQPPKTPAGIDLALAVRYFQEAQAISDADAGRMWGVRVYGPLLFVDEGTRQVVANRPDYKDLLKSVGDVYAGTLPDDLNIANTAMRWGGVDWTMVRWPLPENRLERDVLMIHESFHRIQEQLGLDGPDSSCDHLDTRDGRVWLRLEWRALMAALAGPKPLRRKATEDALLFRAYRRSLFKDAAGHEQALEMHEGLPEYTGIALAAKSREEIDGYVLALLQSAPSYTTFVRSFAYATGPAYGLLLDEAKPHWQKALKVDDDLAALLAEAAGVSLPADLRGSAEARALVYGGKTLMAEEDRRAQDRALAAKELRGRFAEGPVLFLPPVGPFSYSFDPTNQVPLEGLGTVYPYVRITAAWGILEAKHGALMLMKEGMIAGIRVPAPKDPSAKPLTGDGWTLTLNDGWSVLPAARKGDFELKHTALQLPEEMR
jgi:hypothetical protein